MPVHKITISLPEEVDEALTLAYIDMKSSKSRVIEVFLREHPRFQKYVELVRDEPDATVHAVGPRMRTPTKRFKASVSASG